MVNLPDLQNFSQIFIIACDSDSVVQRQIDVSDLIKESQLANIPMRDLTINKKEEDDNTKGLTESR